MLCKSQETVITNSCCIDGKPFTGIWKLDVAIENSYALKVLKHFAFVVAPADLHNNFPW